MISSRPSHSGALAAVSAALLLAGIMALFFIHSDTGRPPEAASRVKKKKVLLIGIDGCRSDALAAAHAPHLQEIIAQGTVTWNAFAGGELGRPSQQPTVSGPGWSSILCGVWADKHKVLENKFHDHQLVQFPHFFRRLKDQRPELTTAQAVSWPPLDEIILTAAGANAADRSALMREGTHAERDAKATDAAVRWIGEGAPDVLFLYFNNVDESGHALGFSVKNPVYMQAITEVDGHVGRTLSAIRSRREYAEEDWLVVVTTDHGGRARDHGGQSPEERRIFLIVSGGAWPAGIVSADTPGQTVVPAIIAAHLGIAVNDTWGWETPWTSGQSR